MTIKVHCYFVMFCDTGKLANAYVSQLFYQFFYAKNSPSADCRHAAVISDYKITRFIQTQQTIFTNCSKEQKPAKK